MLRIIKLKTKVNFSTYKIEKDTDCYLFSQTTVIDGASINILAYKPWVKIKSHRK